MIAYVGRTGHVIGGAHLHFSITRLPEDDDNFKAGIAINPYLLFLGRLFDDSLAHAPLRGNASIARRHECSLQPTRRGERASRCDSLESKEARPRADRVGVQGSAG